MMLLSLIFYDLKLKVRNKAFIDHWSIFFFLLKFLVFFCNAIFKLLFASWMSRNFRFSAPFTIVTLMTLDKVKFLYLTQDEVVEVEDIPCEIEDGFISHSACIFSLTICFVFDPFVGPLNFISNFSNGTMNILIKFCHCKENLDE